MATANYTKHDWQTGETITEALLDNMEAGIESAVKGVQTLEAAQLEPETPAISSVQVETLEAGQVATATIEGGVLKLGIPKGEKGDQGEPGQDGAPGEDGADGAPGTPGKDGANGADGEDGAPGADGQDGEDGAPGERGSKIEFVTEAPTDTEGRLEGDMAINTVDWKVYAFTGGAWAEKGSIKGADGAKGADGKDGAKGDPGEQGEPGAAGKDGADGEDGAKGADGKQGASYRISTETFSASKADCQASAVAPGAGILPIIVGDLIEDATGAVWQVASVSDSTFTVGAAAVKAAAPAA